MYTHGSVSSILGLSIYLVRVLLCYGSANLLLVLFTLFIFNIPGSFHPVR